MRHFEETKSKAMRAYAQRGQYHTIVKGRSSGGLDLSLVLIHIYVTAIKRTLQSLWVPGVAGSLLTYKNLAQPAGDSLVQYVVDNLSAVWFIGPLFAALTGLVFKRVSMKQANKKKKEDIDGRVCNALEEDEEKALIAKLEQQELSQNGD